jgi:hypothetical protein
VVIVQIPNIPKLPETTREEAQELLHGAIRETLGRRFEAAGYALSLRFDGGKTPPTNDGEATVIRIEKIDQRNRSNSEILDNPGGPKSLTKVTGKMWLVRDGKANGPTKIEGTAGGGYFGTTDRYELGGGPAEKTRSIRLTNQKRLEAIAEATWQAIRLQFPAQDSAGTTAFGRQPRANQTQAAATTVQTAPA